MGTAIDPIDTLIQDIGTMVRFSLAKSGFLPDEVPGLTLPASTPTPAAPAKRARTPKVVEDTAPKRKGGRPKGSKNQPRHELDIKTSPYGKQRIERAKEVLAGEWELLGAEKHDDYIKTSTGFAAKDVLVLRNRANGNIVRVGRTQAQKYAGIQLPNEYLYNDLYDDTRRAQWESELSA